MTAKMSFAINNIRISCERSDASSLISSLLPVEELQSLKAPFPYFGGKSKVADVIWDRLGDVVNYVEPFFGSGAVLLARKQPIKTVTVCDKDHFIANFWRAVKYDPNAVAHYANNPVIEVELHLRHWNLLTTGAARLAKIETDESFYDAEVAGNWVWGACAWIGSGWCSGNGPWQLTDAGWIKRPPHIGDAGRGINRQLPHIGNAGQGINRKLPHVGDAGRGINRKLPHVGNRQEFITSWIVALSERLRDVRVTAGDWSRICGPSVTHRHGLTGVFLDPPYSNAANRKSGLYRTDDLDVAVEARKWAIREGDNPLMRIAFAGYDGEHVFPDTWTKACWKANGGYGSQGEGRGRANSSREMLWFSPHCKLDKRVTLHR
jgi:DNA adenine methylase